MWLLGNIQAASDRPGVAAEQDADVVLRLLNGLLGGYDLRLRLLQQSLRLVDVGDSAFATLELDVVELQDFLVDRNGLFREFELIVVLTQQEVVGSDRCNQRSANYFLTVFCRQQ